jgi:hypothetical protein
VTRCLVIFESGSYSCTQWRRRPGGFWAMLPPGPDPAVMPVMVGRPSSQALMMRRRAAGQAPRCLRLRWAGCGFAAVRVSRGG